MSVHGHAGFAIYPTLSQVTYWGVGDIDECSILATYWAAKAAGYSGSLPSIAEFRAKAGRPDRPGPTGLTNAEVWAGITGTGLGKMDVTRVAPGTGWGSFVSQMATGGAASVALTSRLLPGRFQYGFGGGHRVGVTIQNGRWYIADPLARDGSRPLEISEADLKRAVLGFGGGYVSGVIFHGKGFSGELDPAETDVLVPPKPSPVTVMMDVSYDSASSIGAFTRGRHERRGAAGVV